LDLTRSLLAENNVNILKEAKRKLKDSLAKIKLEPSLFSFERVKKAYQSVKKGVRALSSFESPFRAYTFSDFLDESLSKLSAMIAANSEKFSFLYPDPGTQKPTTQ